MFPKTSSSQFTISIPLEEEHLLEVSHFLPENLKTAAQGRINEYLAGRYCALQACKQIGYELTSLDRGVKREPLWPKDIVGSISHTKDFAISCVAKSEDLKSIGVDIEKIITSKRMQSVQRLILRSEDKDLIQSLDGKTEEIFTLIFSAKESLYKLLFPFCQCYFDFQEAFLTNIDLDSKSFIIKLVSDKPELLKFRGEFLGSFDLNEKRVITLLELKNDTNETIL